MITLNTYIEPWLTANKAPRWPLHGRRLVWYCLQFQKEVKKLVNNFISVIINLSFEYNSQLDLQDYVSRLHLLTTASNHFCIIIILRSLLYTTSSLVLENLTSRCEFTIVYSYTMAAKLTSYKLLYNRYVQHCEAFCIVSWFPHRQRRN